MADHKNARLPHLGKLSIAILEHLVKPVIGAEAIAEIKAPVAARELRQSLEKALADTERRFVAENADNEAGQALLGLPLADLPSFKQAVSGFYARPADPALGRILRDRLATDFPRFSPDRVETVVDTFLKLFRQELASSVPGIREKLKTLAGLGTEEHTARIVEQLDQLLEQHTPPLRPDLIAEPEAALGDLAARLALATALHQLPPPPSDFTGREAELAELSAALEKGGVTISGLRGLGGVGKTVLALKLAEQLTPRYPDAQFYLDLKGTGPWPLTPAEAMSHVIRAYHPTAKLPESEAELRGLYHTVLHGQRALLLMDNAANAAQVKPLIPPANCILLVTSRRHFYLPGLHPTNLDTLPPADARKLLLTIAPRLAAPLPSPPPGEEEADAAGALAHLCGYLPLALRLAASALAERIDLSPADYLRRLADAQQRRQLVDASLGLSYDLLNPGLQQRWAMLAVFPTGFDRPAAAAVWSIAPDPAQEGRGLSLGTNCEMRCGRLSLKSKSGATLSRSGLNCPMEP